MSIVRSTIEEGLARIVLDDGKANAINATLLAELDAALDQAESERAAIAISGRAGFFSGGLDLKTLPTLDPAGMSEVLVRFTDVMLRLFTFPRPVTAAITGHAVAGGAVLALCADERYAAAGAFRLGLTETALGVTLPGFVVEMARAQIAQPMLRAVVTEGRAFDPEGALRAGLIDEVVPPDRLIDRAVERARFLGALPYEAYRDNKLAIRSEFARRGREAFDGEIVGFARFLRRAAR